MMKRPWRVDRHNKKNGAAFAALGAEALKLVDTTVAPERRIENMIRHDVNQADLSKWRNEGWQVVHYQFVNDGELPVLAVVMERVVEVVPDKTPPQPSPNSGRENATEIVIEPNGLVDKLSENKPIFAAICEKGVDAVIDEMNAEVIEKAYSAFHAFAEKDKEIRRFESRLLSAGSTSPEEETITIEVVP